MTTPTASFTSAAYVRSHGRTPSGEGTWAFQASRTDAAYSGDLYGRVVFVTGRLVDAKSQAVAELAAVRNGTTIAVLP